MALFLAAMLAIIGWPLLAMPLRLGDACLLTDQRLASQGLLIAAALHVIGSREPVMIARDADMPDGARGQLRVGTDSCRSGHGCDHIQPQHKPPSAPNIDDF